MEDEENKDVNYDAARKPRFGTIEVERDDGTVVPFAEYMADLTTKAVAKTGFEVTATYDRTRLRPSHLVIAITGFAVAVAAFLSSLPTVAKFALEIVGTFVVVMSAGKAVERVRVIEKNVNGKTTVTVIPHSELKDDESS